MLVVSIRTLRMRVVSCRFIHRSDSDHQKELAPMESSIASTARREIARSRLTTPAGCGEPLERLITTLAQSYGRRHRRPVVITPVRLAAEITSDDAEQLAHLLERGFHGYAQPGVRVMRIVRDGTHYLIFTVRWR